MSTIACPGCGKQFKLPANAAGKTASCTCGKRFKIVVAAPKATSVANAANTSSVKATEARRALAPAQAAAKPAGILSNALDDDFWNEELKVPVPKPARQVAASPASALQATSPGGRSLTSSNNTSKPKRKKKSSGFHWGADWGVVAAGLLTFVIFGGLTVVGLMAGRIFIFFPFIALGGLLKALSGLMGD